MERLTGQDLMTFWPELRGWAQDLGALAVFDGAGLLDPQGELRLSAVRAAIESRLHRVPRFRQVLYVPRLGLGRPLWADAASFRIDQHVQAAPTPPPGDDRALIAVVEQLRLRPLPRSRPLWQMWFLPGLAGGRVGFYLRVHHAIADGQSAVVMLGALLDPAPDATREPGPPWALAPVPSARSLFADAWRARGIGLTGAVASAVGWLAGPHHPRAAWHTARTALADMRSPRSSLNCVVGVDRRIILVRSRLEPIRAVAHAHAATVNDVLLTAVAGGLRELLVRRGDDVAAVVLRAMVPVSLRGIQRPQSAGNQLGSMIVPLPVGESDPVNMVLDIAADTRERKKRTRPRRSLVLRSQRIQRAALTMLARQQVYHVYLADVPGPPQPYYLTGARMLEMFPVVALMGNLSVAVGALSYAGQLNITVVGDRIACPDVDVVADGLRETLRSLGAPVDVDCR